MYESRVNGEIAPAQGLDRLVKFLQGRGYQTRPWRYLTMTGLALVDGQGQETGLFVGEQWGTIQGKDQWEGTYAFDGALLDALQAAADEGLIAEGHIVRQGSDPDDEETYTFDGQWCRWVSAGAYVPLGAVDQAQRAISATVRFTADSQGLASHEPLSRPLTYAELAAAARRTRIEAVVLIDLDDAVLMDADWFLDRLSELVTGTHDLVDVEYQVVGHEGNRLLLVVRGNACFILKHQESVVPDVSRVPIVLPATDAPVMVQMAFRIPVPGSVAVAVPGKNGGVDVYFEGGIYDRTGRPPTDQERDEYAICAAGRAVQHYPTRAKFHLPAVTGLVAAGHVDTTTRPFAVSWDEAGLQLWREQHILYPACKVGYVFHVAGEYCKELQHLDDPADEDWIPFGMSDLHPAGEESITIWTNYGRPCPQARQEAIDRAITIVEWMRGFRGWEGFDAGLWIGRPGDHGERVMRWELV
jgi:hypothetical protein